MGVTIDNLQIEIQSSSTNAAKGIDDLASSLEKLKKNGAFKKVSTNLNELSSALNKLPNVHQASNSLRTLANSIEKLKSVGTVAGLSNSLKKLPEALKGVASIDLDRVAPSIRELAAAVVPLSQVKAGGLGTMVNAIKNLGKLNFDDIAKNLDDTAIKNFTERVKILNQTLGPFAEKMATVKSAFGAINSKARSAASGVRKFDEGVDSAKLNLASLIEIARTFMEVMQAVIQRFTVFMDQAIEWDGIAARFGRGFGTQASETYEWIQRLNEEMNINIQEFMKYSSVYSTMLTGFGVAADDAGKMALGYMELTYDIWAGYNDVYRSLEDAAEAVKSAIAGEVEPVRRAGFTIVEATLEQTAANHGLEISLANATEAQKSYLRYLTLVDQAYAQSLVGTYAKEMNTAEGLMRTLAQQLKSLAQAFGSLFLPILVKVVPWVQAFVELLTEGVKALAAMFGITIQGVDWGDYNSGVNDAVEGTENVTGALEDATAAAKELKNASIGIDELNVISPSSAAGGSGAGGTGSGGTGFDNLDVDSLWDESIFKDINDQVDAIKEKLKGWLPVVSAIGTAFGALSLALLLASLGESLAELAEMEGKVAGLKRALAGLAILTIEAVLVFALSDEYLETGNFMALIGEALVTATGGYLMYKGFGPKGLVVSLAVSMLAQLAAITVNLADGGVEMDDPQLWIQAAFTTALGGVAGGYLSYKGLINVSKGKGVGLGLTLGLSLSLASITIGDITANGGATKESILTGIGSVVAAAGFGFMVGGVWGAVIGAVVGLVVNIGGAIIGTVSANAEENMKKDLESRFGKITLDSDSLEVYVDKITAIPREIEIDGKNVPVVAALDIYMDESKVKKALGDRVDDTLKKLDMLNVKIAVGVNVEQEEYMSSIEALIQDAQGYLEQHYLTTSIAITTLNSESSAELSSVLSSFYATNSKKLAELGSRLKETVSDAFVDGEWIPNKLQEALELQEEIQEILERVSDVEYRATMQNIELSIQGTDLTPDSFKDVMGQATEAIENRLDALEEVKMSNLQVAIMQYDANIADGMSEREAKDIYNTTVADIEEAYRSGRVDVTYGSVDFGLETLRDAYSDELDKAKAEGWFDFELQLDRALLMPSGWDYESEDGSSYLMGGFKTLLDEIEGQITTDLYKVSDSTRDGMEELLETLKPTMGDYEKIATANRKAGTTVTKNIRDGLNDYNELKALSGDTEAINYLIGQGFSSDGKFLNTLSLVEGAGEQITGSVREGLLNNIDYVYDDTGKVLLAIKDSTGKHTVEMTPTLRKNLEDMGVNITGGLTEGVESKEKDFSTGLWDGIKGGLRWVGQKLGIHSPSTVTRDEIGKPIADGIVEGMKTNSIKDRLSTMWTNAKTWWDTKKGSMKAYTPSIGSIYDKVKERWDNARTWWNSKKSGMKTYTPSIGSIYEKVYDRWKNARDWWNGKKGSFKTYTPSIGSITDKLKSAWNSAKSWWNKNVKLNTKLNVQVPTIKVKWDTASAFGKSFKYPTGFSLKFAADGGIFDQGSLIWAGERGPEIMANAAGGKTGVMNVQQMQDAVYEGVYAAVVAAMKGNSPSGGQDVRVYLDGREISRSVEKHQRERGTSIMGNEVYSY